MDRSFIIPIAVAAGVHSLLFISGSNNPPPPTRPLPPPNVTEWDISELLPPEPPEERVSDEPASEKTPSEVAPPVSTELLTTMPNPDDFIQKAKLEDLRPRPSSEISRIESGWETLGPATTSRTLVFDPRSLDNPPATRFQPAPGYPRDLRAIGSDGTATIVFSVDVNGTVFDAAVTHATHSSFGEEALRAVRRWRFEPGLKNGKRVAFRMVQTFAFTLAD